MKLRLPPRLVRWTAVPAAGLLARSWRVEDRSRARWREIVATPGPRLGLLWHEALLPLLWTFRQEGVVTVVSRARDGQYLAEFARALGYRPVLGSSHRGRHGAMRGLVSALESGAIAAVTPDGPRGPRRRLKSGALRAAARTGALIFTAHADARPARRLASWDRFLVPAPFARVRIALGAPFRIGSGPEAIAEAATRVEADLSHLAESLAWHADATPTG